MNKPLGDLLPNVDDARLADTYSAAIAEAVYGSGGRCCTAVAEHGALACTCWEQVHDTDQTTDLAPTLVAEVMPRPCHDCAYRKDSPERLGVSTHQGGPDFLEQIVVDGERFWCHDGMRQVIALVHRPTGARIEIPRDVAYDPLIADGVPYRANGTPGALCAGWAARRLKHVTKEHL